MNRNAIVALALAGSLLTSLLVAVSDLPARAAAARPLGVGGALSNWHVQNLCGLPATAWTFNLGGLNSQAFSFISHNPNDSPWTNTQQWDTLTGGAVVGTNIKWFDPPPTQVKTVPASTWAHFGYTMWPGLNETTVTGQWTLQNAGTCAIDEQTLLSWNPQRGDAGAIAARPQHAEDVRAEIRNPTAFGITVQRRAFSSTMALELNDLSPGGYVDVKATLVDDFPVTIDSEDVLPFEFKASTDPEILAVSLVYTVTDTQNSEEDSYVLYGAVNFQDPVPSPAPPETVTPPPTIPPPIVRWIYLPHVLNRPTPPAPVTPGP